MTLKVYGPYRRADGRQHVIYYDTITKKRTTQSYPRYLMEVHLGRKLESNEEVDHINEDHTDNRIENLQLITHADNNKKNVQYRRKIGKLPPKWYEFICPCCNQPARILTRYYKANQLVQGKAGPYCSRRCAGKTHN